MSLSDPVADGLTRIRNAVRARKKQVTIPSNRLLRGIVEVLQADGFIENFQSETLRGQEYITIWLKYSIEGESAISEITRVSRPGRRVYCGVDEIPRVLNGLGLAIVSTSKGVLSDRRCRELHVGGELLCTVY